MKAYYVAEIYPDACGNTDLMVLARGDVEHFEERYPESGWCFQLWKLFRAQKVLLQYLSRKVDVLVEKVHDEFGEQKSTCQPVLRSLYDPLLERIFSLQKKDVFIVQNQSPVLLTPSLETFLYYSACEEEQSILNKIFDTAHASK